MGKENMPEGERLDRNYFLATRAAQEANLPLCLSVFPDPTLINLNDPFKLKEHFILKDFTPKYDFALEVHFGL